MRASLKLDNLLLLKIACFINLAISLLPVVDYYCPWYVTAVPVLIVLFVTLNQNTNVYPLLPAVVLILGFGFLSYWTIYRSSALVNYFINLIIAFIPCIMAIQISKNVEHKEFFQSYLKTAAIFIGITCVTTIIGLKVFPMASRELASGTAIYDTAQYTRANIGGYDFIYALVLFIPVALWLINNSKGAMKVLYTAVLVLDVWCIYESQYTIALICVAITLLVLWIQFNKRVGFIALLAVALFLLFNGFSLIGSLFYWLSDVIEQEYVADRLLQLAQLFSGESINTDTSSERIEHYFNELNAFSESPVWGHNFLSYDDDKISGHTLVLDILGGAGLIGIFMLSGIMRTLYTLTINPQKKRLSPYIQAIWIMLIILSCLNPVVFPLITVIAFMCCICIKKLEE